jgi:hypothetical protein
LTQPCRWFTTSIMRRATSLGRRSVVVTGTMRFMSFMMVTAMAGCGTPGEAPAPEASEQKPDANPMVGYDLRSIRPRDGEALRDSFERQRHKALAEGKQVAVLLTADWCERCRMLELELGKMHPESMIAHIRILKLKEEDWEAVTRMNEFRDLNHRWSPVLEYPMFVLLDDDGERVETEEGAKARLLGMGVEPTLPYWFESVRKT